MKFNVDAAIMAICFKRVKDWDIRDENDEPISDTMCIELIRTEFTDDLLDAIYSAACTEIDKVESRIFGGIM